MATVLRFKKSLYSNVKTLRPLVIWGSFCYNNFMSRPHGYTVTESTKEKIRNTMLGKKYPKERCIAMGLAKRGMPAWNKGIGIRTKLTQMIRSSAQYFDWRRKVFSRDGFKCTDCGVSGGWNKELKKRITLNADHIKAFSLILTENNVNTLGDAVLCNEFWDTDNGRTLCTDCHKKTDNFGYRAKHLTTINKCKII